MIHERVSKERLAVVRMGVFTVIFLHALTNPLQAFHLLPPELHVRIGLARLLPDVLWDLLRTEAGLMGLRCSLALTAVLAAVGIQGYRYVAAACAALLLVFEGCWHLGSAVHSLLVVTYAAILLAAFPAADAFALRKPPSVTDDSRRASYAGAMQVITFTLLLTYTVTGLYRIAHGAPDVWSGSMISHLLGNSDRNGTWGMDYGAQLVRAVGDDTQLLDVMFVVGSVLESMALFCVFSRKAVWFYLCFALIFHVMNLALLNIEFSANIWLVLLVLTPLDPWLAHSKDPEAQPVAS
jgi:hypothetical protein